MTPEEFRSLLDTYGADLTLWPHQKRHLAHQLMQDSVDARNAFAEAREFDDLLRGREPELPDANRHHLLESIMDGLDEADNAYAQGKDSVHPPKKEVTSATIDESNLTPARFWHALLVRPLAPLCAACFACGLVVGAGVYMESTFSRTVVYSTADYLYPVQGSELLLLYGR